MAEPQLLPAQLNCPRHPFQTLRYPEIARKLEKYNHGAENQDFTSHLME